MEEVLGEIERAEAGSLRTEDRTAPGHSLAGEDTGVVLACQFLIHAVEETYLAAADTYVARRDILVRADAAPELEHEGLAETHDFRVGLTDGIEVGTALGAAHREGCEGILEGLFEAQELEHRRSYGAVETESAFVRADRAIELHAIAEVGLHLTLVVNPCHTEREDTIGLDHSLHDLRFLEFGVLVVHLFNRLQYLLNRLQVLCFPRVFCRKLRHDSLYFHNSVNVFFIVWRRKITKNI